MNNKPTCETYPDGSKEWRLNGKLHREDGPAFEGINGYKEWWLNCKHHREDGPAVEYPDSSKEWWFNGKRHREDGPAVEHADGYKSWWLNGINYTKQEYWQELYRRGIITEEKMFLELI